jgi:hypothetical protein
MNGIRGGRCKQLLDDLEGKEDIVTWKTEALDRTLW